MADTSKKGSGDRSNAQQDIHTPAGMSRPASDRGSSADGADIAATDMEQTPSSREDAATVPPGVNPFGGGGAGAPRSGVPVEPADSAVSRLEDEVSELRDRHLRLAAEFDNYRKRVARERAELGDRAQAAFVLRLLEIMDDLDRLVAQDPNTNSQALHEGIVLLDKKFRKELEAGGLERIEPTGETFDPTLHEAVHTLPPPSPEQDHQVSATFQAGYRFKGNLVRPARVQVYSEQGSA